MRSSMPLISSLLLLFTQRCNVLSNTAVAFSFTRSSVTTSTRTTWLASNECGSNILQHCSIARRRNRHFSYHSTTLLSSLSYLTPTAKASSALVVSTAIGMISNHVVGTSSYGTIITLLLAAFFSNKKLVPSSHNLYDLCWTKILPASLSLLLLSYNSSTTVKKLYNNNNVSTPINNNNNGDILREKIISVSIPFVIATIGSVLGCIVSFLLFTSNTTSIELFNKLQPREAAIAAGCLCASYIGGSVNFFATAATLLTRTWKNDAANNSSLLLASMAASDLILMAIYFAGMTAILFSNNIFNTILFPGRSNKNTTTTFRRRPHNNNVTVIASAHPLNNIRYDNDKNTIVVPLLQDKKGQKVKVLLRAMLASTLAWGIVELSVFFETLFSTKCSIPGTSSAVIVMLSTFIGKKINCGNTILLSEACFHLLFAAIGVNCGCCFWNKNDSLQRYGLASFIFCALALGIHCLFTLLGSWSVGFLKWKGKFLPLELEEVMVASNAAIGGPATAAAFAGSITNENDLGDGYARRRGLIVAGTVWGVVGYAIATGIGVALAKILLVIVAQREKM